MGRYAKSKFPISKVWGTTFGGRKTSTFSDFFQFLAYISLFKQLRGISEYQEGLLLKRGENSIEKGKSKNKERDEMKGVWGFYLLLKLYVCD